MEREPEHLKSAFTYLSNAVENRQAEMFFSTLSGGHSANHPRAVLDSLPGVESSLLASESLADDLRVFIQNHVDVGLCIAGPNLR